MEKPQTTAALQTAVMPQPESGPPHKLLSRNLVIAIFLVLILAPALGAVTALRARAASGATGKIVVTAYLRTGFKPPRPAEVPLDNVTIYLGATNGNYKCHERSGKTGSDGRVTFTGCVPASKPYYRIDDISRSGYTQDANSPHKKNRGHFGLRAKKSANVSVWLDSAKAKPVSQPVSPVQPTKPTQPTQPTVTCPTGYNLTNGICCPNGDFWSPAASNCFPGPEAAGYAPNADTPVPCGSISLSFADKPRSLALAGSPSGCAQKLRDAI